MKNLARACTHFPHDHNGGQGKNRFLYQYNLGTKSFWGKKQIVGTLSRTLGAKKDILVDSNAAEAPPLKVKKVIEQVSLCICRRDKYGGPSRRDWL